MSKGPSYIRKAHGTAAKGGAILVVEQPPLDELLPVNAADTVIGLALRATRGRPFTKGNRAAADRGPSLTMVVSDPHAPEEQRRLHRKAKTLADLRRRELEVQHGGPVSSAVKVELVAWARATAWAEVYDRLGDGFKSAQLSEKASGHQLKAIGFAQREAAPRKRGNPMVRIAVIAGVSSPVDK